MYYLIKNLHVTCVVLSAAGFLLRGTWMLTGSALLQHRLTGSCRTSSTARCCCRRSHWR